MRACEAWRFWRLSHKGCAATHMRVTMTGCLVKGGITPPCEPLEESFTSKGYLHYTLHNLL